VTTKDESKELNVRRSKIDSEKRNTEFINLGKVSILGGRNSTCKEACSEKMKSM